MKGGKRAGECKCVGERGVGWAVCLGMAAHDGQAQRPRVGSSINGGKGIMRALAGVNLQGGN